MLKINTGRKHVRSLILPPWNSLVPGRRLDEVAMAYVPPIRVYGHGEINIDFKALTLVDTAVFDKQALDCVLAQKSKSLRPLRDTLRTLQREGFLKVEDLAGRVNAQAKELKNEVDLEMERWHVWLPTIRSLIIGWAEFRKALAPVSGSEYSNHLHSAGAIRDYILSQGHPLTAEKADEIEKIVLSKKKRRTAYETSVLKHVTRFYLEYAFANIVARSALDEPFVDWANVGDIYKEKMRLTGLGAAHAEQIKASEFFSMAFPSLAPASAEQLLALKEDKRLTSFRKLISEAAAEGQVLDKTFAEKAAIRMAQIIENSKGPRRWLSAAGLGAGIISAFAFTAPIYGALATLATSAGQEATGATLEKFLSKDMDWLFCLVERSQIQKPTTR